MFTVVLSTKNRTQWTDPVVTTWVFKNFVIYGAPREVKLLVNQVSELSNERDL
jgi:hypothetical protein